MSLIYFLLFASFVISSHPGYSMKIVITPNNYDGIIPTAFKILCTPKATGNCVRKILAIQVAKNGSRPLATLQQNSKLLYNPLLRSSVKAEGVINTGAANSKLTVTFSDVVKQDSGVYTCTSIYLDEWGHLQQDAASHNFTVKDHDIHDIVRYLVGKLASMETLVHTLKSQQESDIGKLDNRTTAYRNEVSSKFDELVDSGRNQTKMIGALNDKVTTLEKTVTDQEKQLQEQSKHLKEQNAKVSSKFNELMATDRNQSNVIEALTDKDSFTCAFRASYDNKDKLVKGNTLVFSVPLLDVGNDYNTTTGIFTAPKKGLYVFDLSVRTASSTWYVYVDLKANGVTVASVFARDSDHYGQSSVTPVVSLQAGDQVRPVVRLFNANYLSDGDRHTIFSGFLLKMT